MNGRSLHGWCGAGVFRPVCGAGGGTRTHTTLPSRDFKSLASTSSATSAFSTGSNTYRLSRPNGMRLLCAEKAQPFLKAQTFLKAEGGQSKASIRTRAAALANLNLVGL